MNNPTFRLAAMLLASLAFHFLTPAAHATGQARADYRNTSSAQAATQTKNPAVTAFNGYIKGSQAQTANTVILQECAFGQAFSQWYPSDNYAAPIVGVNGLSGVRGVLYPVTTAGTSRTAIQNSGKPFRYKWLLFDGSGTDVTAFDATSIAGWFTQADRDAIAAQIVILKAAIAASPLDTSLRTLLLDIYYDLAVAEMQATKPKLAALAKFHLGIVLPATGQFVLDKEIDTYGEIDTAFQAAILQFCTLLSTPFPDIDPSSIDSGIPFGTPMGQYIFRRAQPRRDSTPSQYAGTSGGVQEVPDINGSGLPVTRPAGQILFQGYKDLNALLQIVGERKQHLATLCRLRGSRQGPGDVAFARQALIQAVGSDDTDTQIIKSWFPEIFPPDLNALTPAQRAAALTLQQQSGVLASLAAVEVGRNQLVMVTPFLNGTANILGYDPEFLLLAQSAQFPPLESYDTLRNLLYTDPSGGGVRPLDVALDKLNNPSPLLGAIAAYNAFQEKVEKVAADLDAADTARDSRWLAITGYAYGATPGFDLKNPAPNPSNLVPSELKDVQTTLQGLDAQSAERAPLQANFDELLADGANGAKAGYAVQAINLAQGKETALKALAQTYRTDTKTLYEDSIAAKATAAGSQAAYEAVADAAAAAATPNPVGGPIAAGVTAVAGAINTAIQIDSAKTIGESDQGIDYAGVDLTTAIASTDVPLTVNQANQGLLALKREQIAHNIAIASDQSARNQAVARQQALLAELARIVTERDAAVKAIRKKSYADPLHYHRAEKALIDADDAFATAQRWMFYTLQALNYKWHGKFATAPSATKTYDTSTLFKCRNANELKDLLVEMAAWDAIRVAQTQSSGTIYTRISLRDHVLARNPRRYNSTQPVDLSADPGTRADDTVDPPPSPLPTLPTLQYFRKVLTTKYKEAGSGDLVIPLNTALDNNLADRPDGNFFRGAIYNSAGVCTSQGFWREKIQSVYVNIVAENGTAPATGISAVLTYAGTTYFHTRTPPRSDRTWFAAPGVTDDHPGELIVTPFRFWESPTLNGDFVPRANQIVPINAAYNQVSGFVSESNGVIPAVANFEIRDFAGRSVAASGWVLRIYRTSGIGAIDAANIKDIEFIISYKHSTRTFPY